VPREKTAAPPTFQTKRAVRIGVEIAGRKGDTSTQAQMVLGGKDLAPSAENEGCDDQEADRPWSESHETLHPDE
jgi:hypothetical protein